MKYLNEIVQREIDAKDLAGASLAVWQHGVLLHRADLGMANIEENRPMPQNGIFRLYSATKPITAVAVMILVERGMLDLMAPVAEYLPEYAAMQVCGANGVLAPAKNQILIKDLLDMTAGLVYPAEDIPGKAMDRVMEQGEAECTAGHCPTTQELVRRMAAAPLAFEPGTYWRYSVCADVLGAVIEQVSGKHFGEFLEQEIFAPLGMEDTAFYVPENKQSRLVQIYEHSAAGHSLAPYTGHNLMIHAGTTAPTFESGGAGLFSTVEDYGRFCNLLLGEGRLGSARILGRKTVEFMRTNQLNPTQQAGFDWPQMKGYGYGNLMRTLLCPGPSTAGGSVGEYGWDGWAGVYMAIDPAESLVIECFISLIEHDKEPMRRRLRAAIYGQLEG